MDKPRCLVLFLESCRSEVTKKDYLFELNKFLKWAKKDYESLLFLAKPELTDLLVDYTLYLKKRVSPNSLPTYFAGLFKFLDMNDSEYNKRKIQSLFGEKLKRRGDRPITDKEINEMIRVSSNEKQRALIHVFSATGCRPEALSHLRVKDIQEIGDGSLSIRVYTGSEHESFVFLHRIASDSLKKYHTWREANGEKISSDSLVFTASRNFALMPTKPLHPSTISTIITVLMNKAKIKREKDGHRNYDLASCGGFRKRFNTIIKKNPEISFATGEKLMDHKNNLEMYYFKPTREDLFEEYKKAIPELVFDESEKLRIENENKQKEIEELKSDKNRIAELERNMANIKEHLEHLKK